MINSGITMKPQINKRLQELRTEFADGQKMLAGLEAEAAELRQTLMRISGAIQVLEELLAHEKNTESEKK